MRATAQAKMALTLPPALAAATAINPVRIANIASCHFTTIAGMHCLLLHTQAAAAAAAAAAALTPCQSSEGHQRRQHRQQRRCIG
jgi:hypothetical protein